MINLWLAFVTGLTTGGISCLTVQGGLLASSIKTDETKSQKIRSVSIFVVSKLVVYTLLGFVLGFLGSFFILSPKIQGAFQLFIGLFLIATAGRFLNLHPVFRHLVIQPPKFLFKLARKSSNLEITFAPAMAGVSTVLVPCGITQAIILNSVSTGSPILGALTMAAFILGTIPVFFALGITALEFLKRKSFAYVAALVVFIFGVISINSGVALFGSNHTLQNYWRVLTSDNGVPSLFANTKNGTQEATITVSNRGYKTNVNTLKIGVPTKLKIVTNNTFSCARAFAIPSLGITKILPETGEETIEFTPRKLGRLNFSCTMGMYTGFFNIVE